jgi:hypothetical protein
MCVVQLRSVAVAQLVGHQHRHPVAAAARQRDADQHVVGLAVGLVHGPHAVPTRHRPVDLDVAEHVLLLACGALEHQPEPLAHRAVRAVGAEEVGRTHRLLAAVAGQGGRYAVGILLKAGDSKATLRLDAVHRQLVAQDRLGGALRNRDEAERHVVRQCHVELRDLLTVGEAAHWMPGLT